MFTLQRTIRERGLLRKIATSLVVMAVLLTLAQNVKAADPPAIRAIHGRTNDVTGISDGCVNMTWGTTYNGARVVNDTRGVYPWTLVGIKFGAAKPTVLLGGRAVSVLSWSDTQIVIDPCGSQINPIQPWSWAPVCTTLKVVTADNRTTIVAANIAPSIAGVIFGQCTYYVSVRHTAMFGNYPTPVPYTAFSPFATNWVPQRGDQLCWTSTNIRHQAIIEQVQRTVNRNTITYMIGISQQNVDCRNGISTFVSSFVTTSQGAILRLPQFSANSAAATGWHR